MAVCVCVWLCGGAVSSYGCVCVCVHWLYVKWDVPSKAPPRAEGKACATAGRVHGGGRGGRRASVIS